MRSAITVADRLVGLLCTLGLAVSAAGLLVCFALVAYSVGMRYFAGQPIPWVDELVGYLLVGIVMLAAADALRRGEHICVDLVTERLGPRGRTLTAAAGQAAVLVVGLALLISGWDTVMFTRMLGIVSTGYLSIPMHLPQLLVPIGGGLLALAALGGLLRMAVGQPPFVETPAHATTPPAAEVE